MPAKTGWLYKVLSNLSFLVLKAFFRFRISGAEHVPIDGGVLIASNHQSFLDPIIISASSRCPVAFMARDTLFKNFAFGWLIGRVNAFPVRRGAADREAIHEAINRLHGGWALLIFPEGRRSLDGSLGELRPGPAMIAHRAGAPIVPAIIKGSYEAWPRTRKLFRFRPISIVYGEPIAPPANAGRETYEKLSHDLHERLEMLMREG